jgi:hypothetical protein
MVPREAKARVEGRLKAVETALRAAEDKKWRKTNPEALARARSTADQLTASLAALATQRDAARARGDEKAAADADAAIAQRTEWLTEAEKAVAEFGG